MSEVEMLYILDKICIASVDVIRSGTKKDEKNTFLEPSQILAVISMNSCIKGFITSGSMEFFCSDVNVFLCFDATHLIS